MKINRKISLLAVAIIVIGAVLFSQTSLLSAIAQENSLKDILGFDTTVPQTEGEVAKEDGNSLSNNNNQRLANDEVVEKAKKLLKKAEKDFLTEGWLHISSTTKAFSVSQNTFPDGSPIPAKWTDDLWVLLDTKGNAIKAVSIQDTGDPTTSQISVFENGLWTNITLGAVSSEPEAYRPTLDSGFLTSAIQYKDTLKLSADVTDINDQKVVVFTTEEKFKAPMKIMKDGKEKDIYGSVYKFYFAENTGLPVLTEDYTVNLDGSLEISQQIFINIMEKVAAPSEVVLSYFTQ